MDEFIDGAAAVEEFGLALRVGQNRPDAHVAELRGGVAEIHAEPVRHLDQEILPSVRHAEQVFSLPGGVHAGVDHDLAQGKTSMGTPASLRSDASFRAASRMRGGVTSG